MSASGSPADGVPGAAEPEAFSLKRPPRRFPRWLLAALALGVMWLTLFFAWPIGLLLAAPAIIYLLGQQRRLGLLCVLGSPYVVLCGLSLLGGIVSYFAGGAQLRTFGMPDREFHNLDPRWRVYRSTSGCIVDGSEIFTHEPNNAVVKLLVSVLGPMRGVYTGPYPGRPEVTARLQAAVAVPRAALQSGTLALAEKTVRLEPQTVAELLRVLPAGELAGVFLGAQGELLLLTGKSERGEQNVALVDSQRGRYFAAYYDLRN